MRTVSEETSQAGAPPAAAAAVGPAFDALARARAAVADLRDALEGVAASDLAELTAQVRASEIRVGALETEYYQAMSRIDESEIASRGFVTPHNVNYVAVDGTPTLTRADR